MIATTLRAIATGQCQADSTHVVYIVRDPETVLYIGRSEGRRGILARLRAHRSDRLGACIAAAHPGSLDWSVELLTREDCQELLHWKSTLASVSDYEWALIRRLSPRLNVIANTDMRDPGEKRIRFLLARAGQTRRRFM